MLRHFGLVIAIWATICSPLHSQGDGKGAPPDAKGGAIPQGKNHVILVGDPSGAKVFQPTTVDANIGDTITFEFHPKAHTVSQSLFETPCQVPNGAEGKGFHSGLTPVKADTKSSDLPRWTLQVLVPTPIWFHCAPHCGAGMVGAINPPKTGDRTFEKFQENARKQAEKGKNADRKSAAPSPELAGTPPRVAKASNGNGPSATLQRSQPITANDLATLNVNGGAATGAKDASNLAAKPTGSAELKSFQQKKLMIISVSLAILLPGNSLFIKI